MLPSSNCGRKFWTRCAISRRQSRPATASTAVAGRTGPCPGRSGNWRPNSRLAAAAHRVPRESPQYHVLTGQPPVTGRDLGEFLGRDTRPTRCWRGGSRSLTRVHRHAVVTARRPAAAPDHSAANCHQAVAPEVRPVAKFGHNIVMAESVVFLEGSWLSARLLESSRADLAARPRYQFQISNRHRYCAKHLRHG